MEKEKIARFSSIVLINLGVKGLLDFVLSPILVIEFGFLNCFYLLMFIYILVGVVSLCIYDYGKEDLLFIESLKKAQKEHQEVLGYNKLIQFIIKKSKKSRNRPFLIFLLSLKNPGLSVIYMREGSFLYNGFTNWIVFYFFLVNIFVINLYFITILYTGFSFGKY